MCYALYNVIGWVHKVFCNFFIYMFARLSYYTCFLLNELDRKTDDILWSPITTWIQAFYNLFIISQWWLHWLWAFCKFYIIPGSLKSNQIMMISSINHNKTCHCDEKWSPLKKFSWLIFLFCQFTVAKLESSNPTIVKAACTAIAEIGRNGPIPLPKGGKTNGRSTTKGSSEGSVRSKNGATGPTKLSLVQRLTEIFTRDSVLYVLEVRNVKACHFISFIWFDLTWFDLFLFDFLFLLQFYK